MHSDNLTIITELRHELHAHPELSMHETWTKARLMDFLREHTGGELHDCGRWFYVLFRSAAPSSVKKPPIAFRADFDAIPVEDRIDVPYRSQFPGIGHKCGHDGHSSAQAGIALELSRRNPADLPRDIYLIFQHAEETGEGGRECAQLLKEIGASEVYACHSIPGRPLGSIVTRHGSMWCASKGLTMHFAGKPAHASLPEEGRNPAVCISELVLYLRDLLARGGYRSMVLGTVVGVKVGESDFGVSAGEGQLSLTLRGEDEAEMRDLERRVTGRAEELAARDDLILTCSESDVFPETRNDDACVDKVLQVASSLGYPVVIAEHPTRSSEDFGWYTKACPGASFQIGNGEDYPPIHDPAFDYRDELLSEVVDLFLALI